MKILLLIIALIVGIAGEAVAQSYTQPVLGSGAILDVQSIRFAENSAGLHDTTDAALQKVAKLMTAFPTTYWKIEGTALLVEREPETLALRRADAVKEALTSAGVDPARITTGVQIDSSLKLPTLSQQELAERRRVEFIVSEQKK